MAYSDPSSEEEEVLLREIAIHLMIERTLKSGKRHTTHLSRDAAKAPELETSRSIPLRFFSRSWSFSKFVLGGGK